MPNLPCRVLQMPYRCCCIVAWVVTVDWVAHLSTSGLCPLLLMVIFLHSFLPCFSIQEDIQGREHQAIQWNNTDAVSTFPSTFHISRVLLLYQTIVYKQFYPSNVQSVLDRKGHKLQVLDDLQGQGTCEQLASKSVCPEDLTTSDSFFNSFNTIQ